MSQKIHISQYYKFQNTKLQPWSLLLLTAVLFTTISQTLLADDYLDALANEAQSTAKVSKHAGLNPEERKQFQKMETLLETERPSTYKFYTKLFPKNKERVFDVFKNDTSARSDKLSHLQKQVMELYFSQ